MCFGCSEAANVSVLSILISEYEKNEVLKSLSYEYTFALKKQVESWIRHTHLDKSSTITMRISMSKPTE